MLHDDRRTRDYLAALARGGATGGRRARHRHRERGARRRRGAGGRTPGLRGRRQRHRRGGRAGCSPQTGWTTTSRSFPAGRGSRAARAGGCARGGDDRKRAARRGDPRDDARRAAPPPEAGRAADSPHADTARAASCACPEAEARQRAIGTRPRSSAGGAVRMEFQPLLDAALPGPRQHADRGGGGCDLAARGPAGHPRRAGSGDVRRTPRCAPAPTSWWTSRAA